MLSQNERLLRGVEDKIAEYASEAKAILDLCAKEGRERTEEETAEVAERHEAIENLKQDARKLEDQIRIDKDVLEAVRGNGDGIPVEQSVEVKAEAPQFKSIGTQFIESKQYQDLIDKGLSRQKWTMDAVELHTKGTLVTTPGTALTPAQYVPGVVEELFQPPTVADLMPSVQATSSVVRYVQEVAGSIDNKAAATLETGQKPESTLLFEEVSEDIRKIATVLPVSDEMLDDAPQIEGYINSRLRLFIQLAEDNDLLNGNGTAPAISGFLDRDINQYPAGTVDNNAVAIFKAANDTRGSSMLSPDAIVMNPANWSATRLLQDDAKQFYGGGPFYGPYGGPQGPASANRFSADNIWGLNVVVTSAIGAGTALLGAFRTAAAVYRKGALTVDSTNSHSDNFVYNITAIRAEERLALAVYRPNAFTYVTGLD